MSQLVLDAPAQSLTVKATAAVDRLQAFLVAYSLHALRISLGLVFLGFGVIKFVPGLSPAEAIASATIDRLTLGLVSGHNAVLLTAVTETVIGLTLVTGRFLRVGVLVLGGALTGITAPLALFTAELFPHGPSLMGQYVLKDIVLAAAALVVAAYALGARLRDGSDA
ncbi:DoxX family membrane protein [Terrabacter sp. MAHUQ-38]|uniref:DoxX family membrane protein n=1 Tax=unclassified Terrabacter TaxID=2630222 RepID=UPI00165D4DCC|nr:DoxX family membrane protein [Terrabacter sp. MAHUQ-38]MBC9820574.1 DoxX family protein [Terrabacter sp. MAHUQ-38]